MNLISDIDLEKAAELVLHQARQANPPPTGHLKKRRVTNGLALLGLTVYDDFVGDLVCAKVRDM